MTYRAARATFILTGLLALVTPVLGRAQTRLPATPTAKLAANEPVRLILMERVSTDRAHRGDLVHLEVHQDVTTDHGTILIRKGTPAMGEVTSLRDGGLLGKGGELQVELRYTTAVDGRRVRLSGSVEQGKRSRSTGKKLFNAAKSLVSVGARVFTGGLVGDGSIKGKRAELEPGRQVEARVAQELVIQPVAIPGSPAPPLPTASAEGLDLQLSAVAPPPVVVTYPTASATPPLRASLAAPFNKHIHLRSGDRLLGRIVSLNYGVYTFENRYGTLHVAEAEVLEIRSAAPASAPIPRAAPTVAPKRTTVVRR